jgi:hypothetical protein
MDYTFTQFISAIVMVLAVLALIFAWRSYQTANSSRRRLAMLETLGLDPAIDSSADLPTIMSDVRQRCEHCPSEDVCERWLRGEETGGNDFCPNARVFEILRKYSAT